jgi:GrpB-like predicted nucleotidyltransferase (UPF0157 family)
MSSRRVQLQRPCQTRGWHAPGSTALTSCAPSQTQQSSPIGSTAIGGIRSKDVVDLLVGVPSDACSDATERLKSAGYVVEGERTGHSWLCRPDENDRK